MIRSETAKRRLGRGSIHAYAFSANFQHAALLAIVVPQALLRLDAANHIQLLGRLAAIGALVVVLVPSMAGIRSIRRRVRGIGRTALLIAGGGLNAAGLIGMAVAPSVNVYTLSLLLAMLGNGVAAAGYRALRAAAGAEPASGSADGARGAAGLLGSAAGLICAGLMGERAVYIVAAVMAAGLVSAALSAPGSGDRAQPEPDAPDDGTRTPTEVAEQGNRPPVDLSRPPERSRDAARIMWARAFAAFGLMLFMAFLFYFFADVRQAENAAQRTSLIAVLALAGAAAAARRLRRRVPNRTERRDPGVPTGVTAGAPTAAPTGVTAGAPATAPAAVPAAAAWPSACPAALSAALAPAVGGWLLSLHAHDPALGYRRLFLLAGCAVAAGVVAALRVGRPVRLPLGIFALRFLVALGLIVYLACACRFRAFGRVPGRRPGTLIVSNHLHDIDGMSVPALLVLRNPLRRPLRFVASQRLFEPGFLTTRFPALIRLVHRLDPGPLFYALGGRPLENMPLSRPLVSYAYDVLRVHGNLPAEDVFSAEALRRVQAPAGARLKDLWDPAVLPAAQQAASLVDLREPYRSEFRFRERSVIRSQLQALEREMAAGATLYLTPEGRLSTDGYLCRFRLALDRLLALSRARALIGISYDPFARRRLSVYVRFAPWRPQADTAVQLRAVRPVVLSQLVCDWLLEAKPERFTAAQAVDAVRERLRRLPPGAFLAPELSRPRRADRLVRRTLANMVRQGVLAQEGGAFRWGTVRVCRAFPHVPDMLAFQRNTFRDIVAALRELQGMPEAGTPPVRRE
jgi:MFS family permease